MARRMAYTMLIGSLPPLLSLFAAKQTPISRLHLDRRLSLLQPEDARTLALIEDLLQWSRLSIVRTDGEIVAQAEAVMLRLDNSFLRDIVRWRLELRTAVAALRRRQRGDPPPVRGERWGYGRWVDHIRRHWSEPHFRLEPMLPWIVEAHRLLAEGDSRSLERTLLGLVWDTLGRAAEGHYFDFEAVVIYVLRWNVVDRWTRYDGAAAADRFERMTDEGLGKYAAIFP